MTSEGDRSQARRDAVAELGAALRELTDAAASTEVDETTLHDIAATLRTLVPPLSAARREPGQMATVDGGRRAGPMYNPVEGLGNPIAPPMTVEVADGVVIGTCTLGMAYEGPPSYVHGGISAMLLDQILGHALIAAGAPPGLTVKLSLTYRRPVPLSARLRVAGWVSNVDGRWTDAMATISTAAEPERVLVEATGSFVTPSAEQSQRLFGKVEGLTR